VRPLLLRIQSVFLNYGSVRNHGGVPNIDPDLFELEIGGLVNKPVKLSLKDLKDPEQFP
jgi:sulfite oxidase